MLEKIKLWYKEEILSDPLEKSAAIGFGIGGPLILVIYCLILFFL